MKDLLLKDLPKTDLLWIQGQLAKAGLLFLEDIDGIYGARTAKAFAQFKHINFLAHPQVYGASVKKALIEIDEAGRQNPSQDPPEKPYLSGSPIRLPHGLGIIYTHQPVTGCHNFTWGEFTKGGTRIPPDKATLQAITKIAKGLEDIRSHLSGRAIRITSGYRPPAVNKAVGGVSNSRHIIGDAADIIVAGVPPLDAYKLIEGFWGKRGGAGWSSQFTHLDCRGGYAPRWRYGK